MTFKYLIPVSAFITFALAWIVGRQGKNNKVNRAFVVFCLTFAIWSIALFFYEFPMFFSEEVWIKIVYLLGLFTPIALFHFCNVFSGGTIKESQKALAIYIILISPFIYSLFFTDLFIKEVVNHETILGPIYPFFAIIAGIYLFWSIAKLIKKHSEANRTTKLQIRYLLVGIALFAAGSVIVDIIFPLVGLGSSYFWLSPLFSLFFIIFTAFAITRYHLFETKVILTELLVSIIGVVSMIQALLSETTRMRILSSIAFIFFCILGYFLIKATRREVERREEKEKMAQELRQAYVQLRKLDQAKTEFMSIASHQLRTPLTAIKGYLSLIKEEVYGEVPDDMEKPLDNVYISSERLIKLVNDLLNISRIESGKVKAEIEKISLEDIIDSIVEELRSIAQEKELSISWKKPEESLPKVSVDKDKIRQVILNLIDNAIRYTEEGEISVKCGIEDDKFEMSVEDTGPGMTKEELSSIFESFRRGSAGKTTWTGGSGLGLYIAKKYVDLHGGRIWAESPGKGKGSTFHLELPINN